MTQTKKRVTAPPLQTAWRAAKEKRDLEMWREYTALFEQAPERARTPVRLHLMARYGFSSQSAWYQALSRGQELERRLEERKGASGE